jgi:hypothetical protein
LDQWLFQTGRALGHCRHDQGEMRLQMTARRRAQALRPPIVAAAARRDIAAAGPGSNGAAIARAPGALRRRRRPCIPRMRPGRRRLQVIFHSH